MCKLNIWNFKFWKTRDELEKYGMESDWENFDLIMFLIVDDLGIVKDYEISELFEN